MTHTAELIDEAERIAAEAVPRFVLQALLAVLAENAADPAAFRKDVLAQAESIFARVWAGGALEKHPDILRQALRKQAELLVIGENDDTAH